MVPPVPQNFPKCGDYQPPRTQDLRSSISSWLESQGDTEQAVDIQLLPTPTATPSKGPEVEVELEVAYNGTFYEYEHNSINNHQGGQLTAYTQSTGTSSANSLEDPISMLAALFLPSVYSLFDLDFDDYFFL